MLPSWPAVCGAGCLALLGCQSTPVAQPGMPLELRVEVHNVSVGQGSVRCALYQDRATFLTREGITQGKSEPAASSTVTFIFQVPADQPLVVSVFQDMNSNEKLDRGALGIPTEPWGFSGKAPALGPPNWAACNIVPNAKNNVVQITLRGGSPAPEREDHGEH